MASNTHENLYTVIAVGYVQVITGGLRLPTSVMYYSPFLVHIPEFVH